MGVEPKTRPAASSEEGDGLIDLLIPFPLNQYLISSEAAPFLDALGRALSHIELRGYVFEIQGHTCDLGSDEYNLRLSQNRADAVKEYLVRKFNLSRGQLRTVGYGKRKPIQENSTKEARDKNRRVTVLNTFQPFGGEVSRISVEAQVKYLLGRETTELSAGQTLTARDNYSVFFKSNERCHVYVFQVGADSMVTQLFPKPDFSEAANPVEAGKQYRLPSKPDQ
jgi:hypothetical protein